MLDPAQPAGVLLVKARGTTELYVFEQGRAIVPVGNVANAALIELAGAVEVDDSWYVGSTSPQTFRVLRVERGRLSTLAELPACIIPAYGTAADDITSLSYGSVDAIADDAERACQSAVAKASVNYVSAVTKAMHGCLDQINNGDLNGDAQELCLGSLSETGIVPPTDAATAQKLAKAEEKVREKIADKCAGGELAALQSCGGDPTSAGDCLACTHWRRGVAAIQSAYGP